MDIGATAKNEWHNDYASIYAPDRNDNGAKDEALAQGIAWLVIVFIQMGAR